MITEGLVALVWAAVAMSFFGGVHQLNDALELHNNDAAWAVKIISDTTLGKIGGLLAILGVVAAPITSGDTAFRSARIIVADFLNFKQTKIWSRLIVSFPLFAVGFALTQFNFEIIWRYMAWSNQTLATVVLWTISVYLISEKKLYWITLVPAIFMTAVITNYILIAPEGLGLPQTIGYPIGIIAALFSGILFWWYTKKTRIESK